MDFSSISTPWKFLIVLSFLIAVLVGIVCLFQACWNLGVVPVSNLAIVDFETSSYLVGFISLIGLLFRGFGHGNQNNSNNNNK